MSITSHSSYLRYPPQIRRATTTLATVVLLLNLAEYLLACLRALYGWFAAPLQLPQIVILNPSENVLPMLLTAHIGLACALLIASAIAFLTPQIIVRTDSLVMETSFGTRVVPFNQLRSIRSVELSGERYIVWVDSGKGLPLQNWIASLLFGRWLRSGFLLTSDLGGFDNVLATLVAQVKKKYGEANFAARFSEEKPSWLVSMLLTPLATIREVAAGPIIPLTTQDAAWQMISVAASLALPQAVAAIIQVQIPWGALAVFLFALLEWPLASLYLADVPVDYLKRMEFQDVLRLYPLTQLPRWWVAAALTLLVIVGAPLFVMLLVPVPAIVFGCYWVFKLTEDWFAVRNPDALYGLLVTAVVQFMLYVLFMAMLAR